MFYTLKYQISNQDWTLCVTLVLPGGSRCLRPASVTRQVQDQPGLLEILHSNTKTHQEAHLSHYYVHLPLSVMNVKVILKNYLQTKLWLFQWVILLSIYQPLYNFFLDKIGSQMEKV